MYPLIWISLAQLLPADYGEPAQHNPVARLQQSIERGDARLSFDADHGYLPALLHALKIPASSQVLVFSQTSFQASRIGPRHPRALYHSLDTTVGFVRGGDVLEIMTYDDQRGVVFYTLDQERVRVPSFARRGAECLQCHQSEATQGVPGYLVRSIVPDRTGRGVFPGPSHVTDHRSPLHERWGGWYVSGTHGRMRHMGNNWVEKGEPASALDLEKGANLTDLARFFIPEAYLTPHSDLVSLMVLEHQSLATNALARAAYQLRAGQPPDLDALAAILTLHQEAPLEAPLRGVSPFTTDFTQATGHAFDLKRRLFARPLSPMVDSAAFRALPASVRLAIHARIQAR